MPVLAEALVALVASLAPWLVAWYLLGGNVDSVEKNIEGFGQAITQGPVKTAVNAYMLVAVFVAGLGVVIWLGETKIAESRGEKVAAPTVEPIRVVNPPVFGGGADISVNRGPVGVTQRTSVSGGARRGGRVPRGRRGPLW